MNGPAAYVCLTVGEARRQIAARTPSKSASVAKEIRKWDVDAAMERYQAEGLPSCQSLRADTLTGEKPPVFGKVY